MRNFAYHGGRSVRALTPAGPLLLGSGLEGEQAARSLRTSAKCSKVKSARSDPSPTATPECSFCNVSAPQASRAPLMSFTGSSPTIHTTPEQARLNLETTIAIEHAVTTGHPVRLPLQAEE